MGVFGRMVSEMADERSKSSPSTLSRSSRPSEHQDELQRRQERPMNGSTKPSVAHPLEEEEILDVAAYQTNLDQSLLAARALVESWAPKHLDSSWDAPPQQSMAAALASRLRPPR